MLALAAIGIDVTGGAPPASAAGVVCPRCDDAPPPVPDPDGGEGRFTGSAALFTPGGEVVDSGEGPSCPGCEWRSEPACVPKGGQECWNTLKCGRDPDEEVEIYWDVYLRRPGDADFSRVARVCMGEDDEMVTTEDVGREVRTVWTAYVPKQRPTMQPPNGKTLVHLPTYFDSGQPERMGERQVPVLDFTITLTAEGEWTWTFEPGVSRTFDNPGSTYKEANPDVQYTYTTPGDRNVILQTKWWGTFYVGSHGPYTIDDPATQTSDPLHVDVVESRAVLGRS